MTHPDLHISKVQFDPSSAELGASGLLGHCSFTVNNALSFDHVAVRITRAKVLTLSWRAVDLPNGERKYPVRPTAEHARVAIEQQVFGALRARGILQ